MEQRATQINECRELSSDLGVSRGEVERAGRIDKLTEEARRASSRLALRPTFFFLRRPG
jgi:hypothetical protein